MHRRTTTIVAALAAAALIPPAAIADSYEDPVYAEFDVENMSRSLGRHQVMMTDPEYHADFLATAGESHVENGLDQLRDAQHGRVYGGLGQHLPGGGANADRPAVRPAP